jgi:hypothetical protein
MNYYSLGEMDSAFAGMWDAETLQDVAIAAGVGGVTSLVTGKVVNSLGDMIYPAKEADGTVITYKADEIKTQQYVKGGLAAVLGFLGAAFIHQYNRPAAFAFAGSMAGEGLAKMIRTVMATPAEGTNPGDDWSSYQLRSGGMRALRATTVELERALRGSPSLAAPVVTTATRQNGLATSVPRKFQPFMG